MTMHFRPLPAKRTRPANPSCRGGASSMLRLAQPSPTGLSGWLGRAVTLPAPRRAAASDEATPAMVVTGLQVHASPARDRARH